MSNDDELVHALADFMQSQDVNRDLRLEQLAEGELNESEREGLETDAQDDEALAEAQLLFAPLSDGFRNRLEADLLAGTSTARSHLQPVPSEPDREAPAPKNSSAPVARPSRWSRRAAVAAAVGALAAAAAVPLLLRPAAVDLPPYALEFSAAEVVWRTGSSPQDGQPVSPEAVVSIILRPEREVGISIEGKLFRTDAQTKVVDIQPERSPEGALRWRAPAAVLAGGRRSGSVTLTAVVGPPGTLDAPLSTLEKAPSVQTLRVTLRIGEPDSPRSPDDR